MLHILLCILAKVSIAVRRLYLAIRMILTPSYSRLLCLMLLSASCETSLICASLHNACCCSYSTCHSSRAVVFNWVNRSISLFNLFVSLFTLVHLLLIQIILISNRLFPVGLRSRCIPFQRVVIGVVRTVGVSVVMSVSYLKLSRFSRRIF